MPAMENGSYWIPELELFLVIWHGERLGQTINWFRWCDRQGNILLWSSQQTEPERQKAEKFAAKLRELGIDPDHL